MLTFLQKCNILFEGGKELKKQINGLENLSTDENKASVVNNLGIYELRALARTLGVVSPTTKKRDFLVNAILDKLSKKETEVLVEQKKGRPYKKLESIDNILNLVNNDSKSINIGKVYTFEDIVLLAQEEPVFDYSSDEKKDKEGVLRIIKNSIYFIDKNDGTTVFVPFEFVKRFGLTNGDYIKVKASKINSKDQFNAQTILKVNQKVPVQGQAQAKNFDLVKVLPTKILNTGTQSLLIGGRNFYILSQPLYLDNDILNTLTTIEGTNKQIFYISCNSCQENELILKKHKNYCVFGGKNRENNESMLLNSVVDCINYSTRQLSMGNGIVIVLEDVFEILNCLDSYFSSEKQNVLGHAQQTNIIMEKLLSLNGAFEGAVDCSLLLLVNELDIEDPFIKSRIIKTSKKI